MATQVELVQAVKDAVSALGDSLVAAPAPTPVDAVAALNDAVAGVETEVAAAQTEEAGEATPPADPGAGVATSTDVPTA